MGGLKGPIARVTLDLHSAPKSCSLGLRQFRQRSPHGNTHPSHNRCRFIQSGESCSANIPTFSNVAAFKLNVFSSQNCHKRNRSDVRNFFWKTCPGITTKTPSDFYQQKESKIFLFVFYPRIRRVRGVVLLFVA